MADGASHLPLMAERGPGWMRLMLRIRLFEESLARLFERGDLVGVVHLSIGQEATAVGVCSALTEGDQITSTHRGHHHMLARGLEPEGMFAEILGKATGYCRGKGGSMHVACFERGAVGANGIVGGGVAIAVGLGVAARYLGNDGVAVAFFGDGAANQGVLHESMNLAAVWSVPVVFVCENNGYAEFTPSGSLTAGSDIAHRADAYSIPGVAVDGNDLAEVHAAALKAVRRARAGAGPTLIECRMQRLRGHHEGEESYAGLYRKPPKAEDPLDRLEAAMAAAGLDAGAIRRRLLEEETNLIDRSLAAAQAGPEPAPESALEDVFA